MASLGKKILSAFVDMDDSTPTEPAPAATQHVSRPHTAVPQAPPAGTDNGSSKFSEHFNRLFADANLPGPDYYEFWKMTEAMQAIADEKARFCAAFAGLQVQGLDKQKLLSSAQQYLQILEADAAAFNNTIDQTLLEKVQSRKKEMAGTQEKIQQLSQEIIRLQQHTEVLTQEIAANEAKIESSTAGYATALAASKNKILQNIDKIYTHIS
ncbi:archaellum component FlaC [Filimonas zeae]|uniref:DUF4047 domain-containing protein n=1 Tax=Filimonas zeae TaxID=1737353 RepID=A0A917INT2_9BACT|nr:DUF4200 domain-containing protein [Filimonas zeae]MDR6337455.1 archaellum component FlaC [Filimonas zeae]GGH58708.1 hypothetical protein GCM10011379_04690 [Filimonas zeae]